MTQYHPDWIFNISLKLAVTICLGTLAMGLYMGVAPITAVLRSGAAFTVFATLGWAAALMWQVPEAEQESGEDAELDGDDAGQEGDSDELPENRQQSNVSQPASTAEETPIPVLE